MSGFPGSGALVDVLSQTYVRVLQSHMKNKNSQPTGDLNKDSLKMVCHQRGIPALCKLIGNCQLIQIFIDYLYCVFGIPTTNTYTLA